MWSEKQRNLVETSQIVPDDLEIIVTKTLYRKFRQN